MKNPRDDAVLSSARREAIIIGLVWLAAIAWTTGYSYANGYGRTAEDLRFVRGVPEWVFWGIFVPWGVCVAFSVWFSLRFMRDDAVEAGSRPGPPAEESPGARGGADAG
jgi:hypothetical protein